MEDHPYEVLNEKFAALMDSAAQGATDLVTPLRALDEAYRACPEDQETMDHCLHVSARTMLQSAQMLRRINAAASQIGSPFFQAALEVAAKFADGLRYDKLVCVIEMFRRRKMYAEMERCSQLLTQRMGEEDSVPARKIRAMHLYELSMAERQQAQAHLEQAKECAEQSARQSERAGDVVGWYYAAMILGGEILPQLGQWQEGYARCERVGREATAALAGMDDVGERQRCQRIVMNCLYHCLNLAVDHGYDVSVVDGLVQAILADPIYQLSKDEPWAAGPLERARAYTTSRR